MRDRNEYLKEGFYFSTLLLIFGILTWAFYERSGNVIVDCGRQPYISELILNGKLLFKDIFVFYGPLSYQVNAFLYKIFGVHLNTLYFAGIANSLLILTFFYLILRNITSVKTTWIASFMLMAVCFFKFNISNFIFPYTYAAIYALSAVLISVFFSLQYLKLSRPSFLFTAGFFTGCSLAFKIDYSVFIVVLLFTAFFIKKENWKNIILFLFSILIAPLLSICLLLFKGLSVADLYAHIQNLFLALSSNTIKYFYSNFTGLYPNPKMLWALSKVSGIFIFNFGLILGSFYLFFLIFEKLPDFWAKLPVKIVSFLTLYIIFPKEFFKEIAKTYSFGWIAVGTAFFLVLFTAVIIIKGKTQGKNIINVLKKAKEKDKLFIFVAIAAIAASLKSFFFINLHVCGTFLIPLCIGASSVFLIDKIPELVGFINKNAWKKSCFIVLFLLGLVYLLSNLNFAYKRNIYPVSTKKGSIYTTESWGKSIDKTINFVKNNVAENDSFVVMPEGILLNFLTDRNSGSFFDSFTPYYVEIFEDEIIRDLKLKKPEYIFISNQNSNDYGFAIFGKNYAENIVDYIENNYNYIKKIGEAHPENRNLTIKIYRIKNYPLDNY